MWPGWDGMETYPDMCWVQPNYCTGVANVSTHIETRIDDDDDDVMTRDSDDSNQ